MQSLWVYSLGNPKATAHVTVDLHCWYTVKPEHVGLKEFPYGGEFSVAPTRLWVTCSLNPGAERIFPSLALFFFMLLALTF